ncbi:MAG: endonuclease III [Nitrospirae bacterium]|nr:endonuclease III [Nitrospirota bacterium]MBF0542390.1 endonuclease III [Nitrospirota bacterium]
MNAADIELILEGLGKRYIDPKTELIHRNPYELLIATILSAQCTDVRVNKVTPELFSKYIDVSGFANADQGILERDIKSTGFFRNKARMIIACSKKLISDYNGTVPDDMDKLVTLPGVGRKTASVILAAGFGIPAIAVDTHVIRLSNRIGLVKVKDPEKIEQRLKELIPQDKWIFFSMSIVLHGRQICKARKPLCADCIIVKLCNYGFKGRVPDPFKNPFAGA